MRSQSLFRSKVRTVPTDTVRSFLYQEGSPLFSVCCSVVTSLQQQLDDLQRSLDCLQESDKNLRLALKMGEMKCRETEIKYQLTSDRCLRLEQRNRRLDHKYRLLLRQHKELEKHLQKKAVLNQMMEQQSPGVGPARDWLRMNELHTLYCM